MTYEMNAFANWQITGCWVVSGLKWSVSEKGGIAGVLCAWPSALWLAGGIVPREKLIWVVHVDYLAFGWLVFKPETEVSR